MAERHVAYAICQTAGSAPQKLIFTHTGWKQIDGQWEFLLPGNTQHDVQLQGKQRSYCGANAYEEQDLCYLAVFLDSGFIPQEILYPCLALVFLSPLNSFLRKIGHEPKFILALIGRTGSIAHGCPPPIGGGGLHQTPGRSPDPLKVTEKKGDGK